MEEIAKMDHNEAIRSMAAEKYLLSDLAPDQRGEFEEHFFSCQECGEDVRAAAVFLEHSKALLSEVTVPPQAAKGADSLARTGSTPWWRALAIPALAVLVVVVAFQNLITVPKLANQVAEVSAPRIFSSASLIAANSRGTKMAPIMVRKGEPFLVFVDINPVKQSPSYVAELYSPSGAREWSLSIAGELAKETLPLQVPGEQSAGQYTLVVNGVDADGRKSLEVGRYPIELQFTK
jgi:hypothetical protein